MTTATRALEPGEPLVAPLVAPAAGAVGARALEFLLTGGITLVLLPLAWVYRSSVGLDESELTVGFLMFSAAFVINDPHFSVTYLLFYRNIKQRALGTGYSVAQRVRYWVAGALVPLALAVWIGVALGARSAPALGWLFELMFALVGWHYVKQGFGVLTVLSARRGVTFSSFERRAILFHCLLGWAYAWASPAQPSRLVEEKSVVYAALAHPAWFEALTRAAFFASALGLVAVVALKWKRERRLVPISPLLGFLVTVWLWTVYSGLDPLLVYVIPALHSIQYLFFVWLMKRNEARAEEGPPSFGRPPAVRLGFLSLSALCLGWFLFHGAPDLLDARKLPAAGDLGPTPYFAAIFAFVNIHHYFMDHVIWRRDNPETRFLRA